MPFPGCTSGLAVSAVVAAVLLCPTPYYHPPLELKAPPARDPAGVEVLVPLALYDDVPAADVVLTAAFVTAALIVYLCDWIQRKLMQRRIKKLNERLSASAARLREWGGRRARLEGSLRAVRAAAAEYELLLHLLLRPRAFEKPDELDACDFI